jgi:hypothetical protein
MWIRIRIRILVRLYSHKKLAFYMKNILEVGNEKKKHTNEGTKAFISKFLSISCSWILICIPSPDLDPGQKNHADPDPQH